MGLVAKNIGLFQAVVDRAEVPLELNPLLISIFRDGIEKFGPREFSTNIIRCLENATVLFFLAPGFLSQMKDEDI